MTSDLERHPTAPPKRLPEDGLPEDGLAADGLFEDQGPDEDPDDALSWKPAPTPLGELLAHVLKGEPAPAGEADEVFRRADRLRRRRTRVLLTAAAVIAATVVLAGYLLTTTLLPARDAAGPPPAGRAGGSSAVPVPSTVTDGVLAVIAPMVDGDHRRIEPRPPARGFGWRQYSVLAADGRPHGTVQVAVFSRPGDFCFPRRDDQDGCAPADRTGDGVDYLRYGDGTDPGWQVNEAIARRGSDGRTVAVMATGERDATDPADAVPPLNNRQVGQLATDQRLFDAFGPEESCDGPSAGACPVLKVPVPEAG